MKFLIVTFVLLSNFAFASEDSKPSLPRRFYQKTCSVVLGLLSALKPGSWRQPDFETLDSIAADPEYRRRHQEMAEELVESMLFNVPLDKKELMKDTVIMDLFKGVAEKKSRRKREDAETVQETIEQLRIEENYGLFLEMLKKRHYDLRNQLNPSTDNESLKKRIEAIEFVFWTYDIVV
ncbi:MAG: hypothetical protein IT289_09355 [Oligoflexia bacterium]|nr:hypothetical protein [Oligoflexia bacterium]